MRRAMIASAAIGTWLSLVGACRAEDLRTFTVALKGHRFIPTELRVPAGKPFFLVVSNQEDATDEFEMRSPPLEKVIVAGSDGRVRVRPLAPGRFVFFDDFHPETSQGAIVAE
jgi:cupredoxin-like protein